MIPDFDEHDNLPPDTHTAKLSEVVKRFGSRSPKRHLLTKRLREFLVWLEGIAVGVYIDGSYVTRKLAPGDVDLVVLLPRHFDWSGQEGQELAARIQRERREGLLHIFPGVQGRDVKMLSDLLRAWTQDRDGNARGIIHVEMKG